MPNKQSLNSSSNSSLSGRYRTCRTPLFLALAVILAVLPEQVGAQANNQPPGSFINASKSAPVQMNDAPATQASDQGQNYQSQSYQGQNYQGQPYQGQNTQAQSTQGQSYQGQNNLGQNNLGQNNSGQNNLGQAYQGNASVGILQNSAPAMATVQPYQQPPAMQPAQAEYPTLDELNQKLAKESGMSYSGTQNQNNQSNSGQSSQSGGTARGGIASSLIKTIGNMAAPMSYGRGGMGGMNGMGGLGGMNGMGGLGGGMGMGGLGGMNGMGGLGGGMGMGGLGGMGMGGLGGMGMGGLGGMNGMGMGMNPFMSPQQQMMNSVINQGARLFSH